MDDNSLQYSSDDAPVCYTLGTDGQFLTSTETVGGEAYLNPEGVGIWFSSGRGATGPVLTGDIVTLSFQGDAINRLTTDGNYAAWNSSGSGWAIYRDANQETGLEIPADGVLILCAPNSGADGYLTQSPNPNDPNYVGCNGQQPIYWLVAPYQGGVSAAA